MKRLLTKMDRQDDPKITARHGMDRFDKNAKLPQVQDRARELGVDLVFMLEDAAATLEPLERAVVAVALTIF